jgi:hypothetical protein
LTSKDQTTVSVLAQSIVKHKHSPKQLRQKEKDSFAVKTNDKINESTIKIVDKSIGKASLHTLVSAVDTKMHIVMLLQQRINQRLNINSFLFTKLTR